MNKYNINDYERPSVAADIVTFGISTEESSNKRHSHIKKLKLLLIKRKEQPFAQQYALPGGFLRKGETIEQTAIRELEEETGYTYESWHLRYVGEEWAKKITESGKSLEEYYLEVFTNA